MKKLITFLAALALLTSVQAQVVVATHAADAGSIYAQAAIPGDVVGPASSTNNAFARFSGTTGKVLQDSPDLTYSTPTMNVPDAFNMSSAGSAKITTASTNSFLVNAGGATPVPAPRFQGLQLITPQNTHTSFYMDAIGTQPPSFIGRRAKGTLASPTTVINGDVLAQFGGEGYSGSIYANSRPGMNISATETWTESPVGTPTAIGAAFTLNSVLNGSTTGYAVARGDGVGRLVVGSGSAKTIAAGWGAWGAVFSAANSSGSGFTITDAGTSGTEALTTFSSFQAITLAASGAKTYTDVFNAYFVAPVQGSNATITRKHTLGIVDSTSASSSITGALIVATTLGTTATSTGIGGGNINTGGTLTTGGTVTVGTTITSINGISTAGFGGVPVIVSAPAISATKTANFTVASYGPAAVAAQYRIDGVITTTSSTNTGTVQFTVDYVDSQGTTHTGDIIGLVDALGVTGVTKTGASKEFAMVPRMITVNNSATSIVIKVVTVGTVSYTVASTISRLN